MLNAKDVNRIFITRRSRFAKPVGICQIVHGRMDARAQIARFLNSSRNHQATVIDVVSWLYSALMIQAAAGNSTSAGRGNDANWPEKLFRKRFASKVSDRKMVDMPRRMKGRNSGRHCIIHSLVALPVTN